MINFKVILAKLPKKSNGEVIPTEVRRFSAPTPRSFGEFTAKLEEFFPSLKGKTYSIYWKDEGHFISVSSDAELQYRLGMGSEICEFYAEPGNQLSGTTFEGVICDSCQMTPIIGHRYKCLQCDNFDLCAACEKSGVHDKHDMIRFVSMKHAAMAYLPPISHGRRKFCMRYNSSSSDNTDVEGDDFLCPLVKRSRHERKHGRKHGSKHLNDEMYDRKIMELLSFNGNPFAFNPMPCNSNSNSPFPVRFGPSSRTNVSATAGKKCLLKKVFPTPITPLDELIPAVRQFHADILARNFATGSTSNPKVDGNGSTETATSTAAVASSSKAATGAEAVAGSAKAATYAEAAAGSSKAATSAEGFGSANAATNAPVGVAGTSTAVVNENLFGDNPLAAVIAGSLDAASATVNDAVKLISERLAKQKIDAKDWTVVDTDGIEAVSVEAPQPLPEPTAAPEQPRAQHKDPKVEQSLQCLESMGFVDRAGILTRILESNDANIYKTLDILIPRVKKSPFVFN